MIDTCKQCGVSIYEGYTINPSGLCRRCYCENIDAIIEEMAEQGFKVITCDEIEIQTDE